MSALTILRAASRDVANERYLEVMEAIEALEDLAEKARNAVEWMEASGDYHTCACADLDDALTRCGVPA